jgi:hypothetical protein
MVLEEWRRKTEIFCRYPILYDRLSIGDQSRKYDQFFRTYTEARRTMDKNQALFYTADRLHISL